MKITTVVLVASLVGNGVLAGAYFVSRPESATSETARERSMAAREVAAGGGDGRDSGADAPGSAAGDAARLGTSGQVESLGVLFRSGNGAELARVLRAAGVSEDMIRAVVREQIQASYRSRIRAIEDAARGDRPWWQSGRRTSLTADQRAEVRSLQRAMAAEVERVLGPDESRGGRNGAYTFLPSDKADAVRQIDADYGDMSRELRDRMEDFRLPSDRDAFRLLEEERRADLAALLSPEELEGWDMRTSSVASRLRRELGTVVQSEAEFREIYRLAAAFDEQYSREGGGRELSRNERQAAEAALKEEIRAMLGPERAAELARQRDPDYRTMEAATARLKLPASATDSVMSTRAQAAEQSQRVLSDPALDPAARRAALSAIAAGVRTQLQSTMGKEGGEAFAQRSEWLRALERGESFSLRPEGGVSIQRGGGD